MSVDSASHGGCSYVPGPSLADLRSFLGQRNDAATRSSVTLCLRSGPSHRSSAGYGEFDHLTLASSDLGWEFDSSAAPLLLTRAACSIGSRRRSDGAMCFERGVPCQGKPVGAHCRWAAAVTDEGATDVVGESQDCGGAGEPRRAGGEGDVDSGSGSDGSDGLGAEEGSRSTSVSQVEEEPPPREPFPVTPFVPAVFLGTMCTLVGREFAVPVPQAEEGDSLAAGVGEVPPVIQAEGRQVESKYERLQHELSRLAMAKQPMFLSHEAALQHQERFQVSNFEKSVEQGSETEGLGGLGGAIRRGVAWMTAPFRRPTEEATSQSAAKVAAPVSPSIQYVSMKTGLSMLCAFPERYSLQQPEAESSGSTEQVLSIENMMEDRNDHDTVVYRVPGVELVINSELGPIRMAPLFFNREQLEAVVGAVLSGKHEAEVLVRQAQRENGTKAILRALSHLATTGRPGQQSRAEDEEDEDEEEMEDPPEVDEFLSELGDSPFPGATGAPRPPDLISFVNTAAYGILATGLGVGTAVINSMDESLYRLSRAIIRPKPAFSVELDTLQNVVSAAAAHNDPLVEAAARDGTGYEMPADLEERIHKQHRRMLAFHTIMDARRNKELMDVVQSAGAGGTAGKEGEERDEEDEKGSMAVRQAFASLALQHAVADWRSGGVETKREMLSRLARLEDSSFTRVDTTVLAAIAELLVVVSTMATKSFPVLDLNKVQGDDAGGLSLRRSQGAAEGSSVSAGESGAEGGATQGAKPKLKIIQETLSVAEVKDKQPGRFQYDVSVMRSSQTGDGKGAGESSTASDQDTSVRVVIDATKLPGYEEDENDSDDSESDSNDEDDVGEGASLLNFAPRLHRNGDEIQASPPLPLEEDDQGEMEGRGEAAPRELQGYILIGNLEGIAFRRLCPVGVGNAADIPMILSDSSSCRR